MSDEMDLLVEQVKMLAGDIAFSTSTLKHLLEQSVNDPDALKTQIQNLESEIQEKRRQMRILEQRTIQSGKASVSNASLVDMQQIKAADNHILQEQLQAKCAENKELQERIKALEQKLSSGTVVKESSSPQQDALDEYTEELKKKVQYQEIENEKLKLEHVQLLEENSGLRVQNQKLLEESSYAKELASAIVVELKNLADEVTQLSLQNVKLEKELQAARELAYSRDDLKIELQASKQREVALEVALAEKEFAEKECRKKVEEVKKREASLENDLANIWVLVAKLKKEGGAIPDSKFEESVNVGHIVSGQKINGFDMKDVLMETESLENKIYP
ncbi:hypothetical protein Ancab_031555 [Ancistrocladus abbreviatus]